MLRRRAVALVALLGLAPTPARALDFKVKNENLRLDITESLFLAAHLDNGTPDVTQINYGELLNRANVQLAWRRFLFSVRFDSGAWVNTPSDKSVLPQNDYCHSFPWSDFQTPAARITQQKTCT